MTTEHRASCQCGQLAVTVPGEPDIVTACNCLACQKRTGAVFGTGAYYPRAKVAISGRSKTFGRTADSGRYLTNHFCPQCGTTVYWSLEMRPDHYGIAVGCFSDPQFAGPKRAIYLECKHHWVAFPDDMPRFEQAAPA
jgi:hypothetical protein